MVDGPSKKPFGPAELLKATLRTSAFSSPINKSFYLLGHERVWDMMADTIEEAIDWVGSLQSAVANAAFSSSSGGFIDDDS